MPQPDSDANSLRRRLLRRMPFGLAHLAYAGAALGALAIPVACILTWLPNEADAGRVGTTLRWLWIAECVGVAAIGIGFTVAVLVADALSRGADRRRGGPSGLVGAAGVSAVLLVLTPAAMAWPLFSARVDLAAYVTFGAAFARGLYGNLLKRTFRYWLTPVAALAGLCGVAMRDQWVTALGLTGGGLWHAAWCLRLWRAAVAGPVGALVVGKPSIREHLAAAAAKAEKLGSGHLLVQALVDVHHWPEALKEARQMSQRPGDYERAATRYRLQALTELRRSEDVLADGAPGPDYALALARTGSYGEAVAYAEGLVGRRMSGSERALGRIHSEAGKPELALSWLERASIRALWNSEARRDTARALMALEHWSEAAVAWRMAVWKSRCVLPEDLEGLSACLDRMGRDREATEARGMAARCRPDGDSPVG